MLPLLVARDELVFRKLAEQQLHGLGLCYNVLQRLWRQL